MDVSAERATVLRSLRAIAALSGSALLVQALSVFSVPVLSRLYAPEHFGVFAAINAITGPVTLVASLQFGAAVLVVPSDEDADSLAVAIMIVATACSVLVAGAGLVASG